jgi:hypothetical protein
MAAVDIKKQIGVEAWTSYFKFCVVRNPFDRAISQFYFECKGVQSAKFDASHPRIFEAWIATASLWKDVENYTIDGRLCMDYHIRYENLLQGLEVVCRKLNVPWEPKRLPRYKSGYRPEEATIARMYSQESRSIINKVYAHELELLGYR